MRRAGPLAAVALCVVAAAASGCSRSEPAAADPTPTPTPLASPSPSPSPTPTAPPVVPVVGERVVTTADVGHGTLLGPDRRGLVDEEGLAAFADAVFASLDAHLTQLQEGVADVGEAAPEDGSTSADLALALATASLASPELPVATARYELTTYHDAGAEFAHVVVEVTGHDGGRRSATVVFAPDDTGRPELVLAGSEVSP